MTVLKFELTIEQANAIINALNMPAQTPATTAVGLIQIIHEQAQPQIAELMKKEEDESKTTS
jgi:hypothetical protein